MSPTSRGTSIHLIAGLMLALAPVAAPAMTVDEFLLKAEALKAKGMGAMFSPDFRVVVREVKSVATAYRAELDGARSLGRTDLGCPPPKGTVKLTPTQFMSDFSAVPVAQRATTSVKTVYYAMMRKRFPCG